MLANLLDHHCCAESSLSLPGSMAHAEWDQVLAKWPMATQPYAQGCSCDHMWSVEAHGHRMAWFKAEQIQPGAGVLG